MDGEVKRDGRKFGDDFLRKTDFEMRMEDLTNIINGLSSGKLVIDNKPVTLSERKLEQRIKALEK